MSSKNYAWAWSLPNLSMSEQHVLLCLVEHENGGKAWPSVARIAKLVGGSQRTVQRAVAGLERSKVVSTYYRSDGVRVFVLNSGGAKMSVEVDKMSPGGCQNVAGGVPKCPRRGDKMSTESLK